MTDTKPKQEQQQDQEQQQNQGQQQEQQQTQGKAADWWQTTRKTADQAVSTIVGYKQMVQKKIDLASSRKKIDQAHSELGRKIDQARVSDSGDPLARDDIRQLLDKLDNLKQTTTQLEQEIKTLKEEKGSKADSDAG